MRPDPQTLQLEQERVQRLQAYQSLQQHPVWQEFTRTAAREAADFRGRMLNATDPVTQSKAMGAWAAWLDAESWLTRSIQQLEQVMKAEQQQLR